MSTIRAPVPAVATCLFTGSALLLSSLFLSTCHGSDVTAPPVVPTQLRFMVQPGTTTAGHGFSPVVKVSAVDASGHVARSYTGSVTVGLTSGTGASGATLIGTTTVAAVNGVATLTPLSIDKTGAGYTLTATTSGLMGATSVPFDITPGPPTLLIFSVPPTTTAAGAPITPAVQVSALDAMQNAVPSFTGSVTVAIEINPAGGTLAGTTSLTAVNGVVTFDPLSIDKVGTGYTLTATTTGLDDATSPGFRIVAGPATQLVFTVQPLNAGAGHAITPAVRVSARDAQGNLVTGFTGMVTVAIGTNPAGGTLAGTTTVAAVNGVATFATLSLNKAGTGYTLAAAATGLSGATSTSFNITVGTASQLVFTVQPTTTGAGAPITPAVQVTALDAGGNTATGFAGSVTVTMGANPGGGTLAGTTTVAAVAGVATFATLSLNKAGTGYTLTAAATGLTAAASTPFDITAGTP